MATTFLCLLTPLAQAALAPGIPVAVPPEVPDQGRAWELVTPADPMVARPYNVLALTPDGDGLFYIAFGRLPENPSGYPPSTANIARRSAGGWTNVPVEIPYPDLAPLSYEAFYRGPQAVSPDLTSSIWAGRMPLQAGQATNSYGLFRRGPDGTLRLLGEIGAGENPDAGIAADGGRFIGASADAQNVVFTAKRHLLAADADRTEGQSIYEYVGTTLRLVDVDDEGALLSTCGSIAPERDGVSVDGRRIFFTTNPSCAGPARVFLREDGSITTEVSASQCDLADCGPKADVFFAGATPSGSSVFLITEEKLTDDDFDSNFDLYRYDVGSEDLTLVSQGSDGSVGPQRVQASSDGSRVYFYSGEYPQQKLYISDGGEVDLFSIVTLESMRISADGRYAVFSTRASLVSEDSDSGIDVYRYDAIADEVTLISRGPGGGNGAFDTDIAPHFASESASDPNAGYIPLHPYRPMSDDGSRIFFTTAEQLVSADRNEVDDVYEWANGSLGLVSAGMGSRPSIYLGATPDASSVFFATADTLVPRDRDGGELDFYVARTGGGFAEAPPGGGCEGTSCRPASTSRATRPPVPSSAPSGRGIAVRRLSASDRRRVVASGWIELMIEVPGSGRLVAEAWAELGQRPRRIASAEVRAAAGPVRLRMRLSKAARQALAAGDDLQVRLALRFPLLSPRAIGFDLEGAR